MNQLIYEGLPTVQHDAREEYQPSCCSLISLCCLFMRPLQRPAPPLLLYTPVLFFYFVMPSNPCHLSILSPPSFPLLLSTIPSTLTALLPYAMPYLVRCTTLSTAQHDAVRYGTARTADTQSIEQDRRRRGLLYRVTSTP